MSPETQAKPSSAPCKTCFAKFKAMVKKVAAISFSTCVARGTPRYPGERGSWNPGRVVCRKARGAYAPVNTKVGRPGVNSDGVSPTPVDDVSRVAVLVPPPGSGTWVSTRRRPGSQLQGRGQAGLRRPTLALTHWTEPQSQGADHVLPHPPPDPPLQASQRAEAGEHLALMV